MDIVSTQKGANLTTLALKVVVKGPGSLEEKRNAKQMKRRWKRKRQRQMRGGGNRTQNRTTLTVQKKGVKFDEDKPTKSSSMIVGQEGNDTDYEDEEDLDTEGELYKLIRGRTSLMIAAASDDSDDLLIGIAAMGLLGHQSPNLGKQSLAGHQGSG
jgi:hypothetical protein